MLTSLKGLLNVGKSTLELEEDSNINANAGADILTHYQQQWAELHEVNETNAKNADLVAKQITELHAKVAKDHYNTTQVIHILAATPTIKTGIENCTAKITNLYESFEKVEKALLDLENLIENVELEQRKIEHRYQYALYIDKKLANLEAARQKLAAEYSQKVMEHEVKQKKTLQERQQVFQEAFNNDLETYRSLGEIPKIEIPTNQPSALLEEIQLDLDKKELDQFLDGT